jgi:serine/threonine protein phosphatase PrpC
MAGEAVIQLEEETDGGIENWFEAEGRLYAVLGPQSAPSDAPDDVHNAGPIRGGLRHVVAYRSHPGLIRDINEDATLAITFAPVLQNNCQPCLGLYAVADGMGGHASGEVASRTAIEGLARVIVQRLFLPELGGEVVLPETPPAVLQEAVQEINQAICQLQESSASDMGTTLTAAVVRDKSVLVANVGDSRTYLWHGGELIQLTADHSLVAQLVAAGAIEPDQIYHHPEKSAIFRSLGHAAEVEVDLFVQTLEAGDRLLLCSDGVWEMLRPDGIEEVLLLEADPQRACDEIVRRSNLAGGEDNISVVIVLFEALVA